MALEVVFGVGFVVFLLFMLFDRLDADDHFFLRLLVVFVNITFLFLIPLHLLGVSVSLLLYRLYLAFMVLFWTYVVSAFIIWVLYKTGLVLPGRGGGKF